MRCFTAHGTRTSVTARVGHTVTQLLHTIHRTRCNCHTVFFLVPTDMRMHSAGHQRTQLRQTMHFLEPVTSDESRCVLLPSNVHLLLPGTDFTQSMLLDVVAFRKCMKRGLIATTPNPDVRVIEVTDIGHHAGN